MLSENLEKQLFTLLDREAWGYFFGYYRQRRYRLMALTGVAAVRSFLFIPVLMMIRNIFDSAIPQNNFQLLILLALGIIAARLASSVILMVMRRLIYRDIHQAVMAMRCDLIEHLYRLNRQFYISADHDSLKTQLVQDTERVDRMSNALFSAIIPALLTSAVLLSVLFILQWQLTLAACLAIPLVMFATWYSGRGVKSSVKLFQSAFEQFSKGVSFTLRYMAMTQEHSARDLEIRKRRQDVDQLRQKSDAMAFSFLLNGQLNENVMNIVGVAVVVCGAIAIMTDTLTLGEFVAFYAAAGLLNGQLGTLTNGLPEILSGNESLSKLHSFHATSAPEAYQNIGHVDFTGSIELRDLSFGYDASPLLKNVNLRIRPSETILITGKNGSGKSTILNLIMGFWKPGKGGLFADGARYDELDIVKLRRDIGYVSQRPEIFPGTVRENICYGQENFDEPTVTSAALQADAKDFIALLTEGYDTQVGDEGTRLSGGQCQKIAIARALMRKPALLLLDEPTNHLDAEAVTRILTDLRISHPEMAVVVVSHDPVIHCYADRVLILHGGDLEEVVE